MQLVIDDNAGFCFGVVRAIGTAEAELQGAGSLYCLGDIVHNAAEVARLRERGLKVIEHDGIERVASEKGARVLIRAHGEPPSTYREAERLGVKLIDATCPIVLALQQRIKHGYEDMCSRSPKGQVVIFGKPGHAEVVGLCGQTEGDAVVVSSAEDLDGIDFSRPMRIYSQTTKSREEYARLIENVKQRCAEAGHGDEEDFIVSPVKSDENSEVEIDSYNDHRIVMAAVIAHLATGRDVIINGFEAVDKSYPSFMQVCRDMGMTLEVLD